MPGVEVSGDGVQVLPLVAVQAEHGVVRHRRERGGCNAGPAAMRCGGLRAGVLATNVALVVPGDLERVPRAPGDVSLGAWVCVVAAEDEPGPGGRRCPGHRRGGGPLALAGVDARLRPYAADPALGGCRPHLRLRRRRRQCDVLDRAQHISDSTGLQGSDGRRRRFRLGWTPPTPQAHVWPSAPSRPTPWPHGGGTPAPPKPATASSHLTTRKTARDDGLRVVCRVAASTAVGGDREDRGEQEDQRDQHSQEQRGWSRRGLGVCSDG